MDDKLTQLQALFRKMGSVIVAFSGGVDSTFLLKVAHDVLGDRALAVTAVSESLAGGELDEAQALAAAIGARHVGLETGEMDDPNYVANTPQRCYFCKTHLGDALVAYAAEHGYNYIVDGNNADDVNDHRPGRRAAQEHGFRSPLQEVGMTKDEIRALSRQLGLSTWDKPAAACLASRIPYGTPVEPAKLIQVGRAEAHLRKLGFRQLRVRHHGEVARIELAPAEFARAIELSDDIVAGLRAVGFTYVSLDLAGYRMGSLNETWQATRKHGSTNVTSPA